MSGLRYLAGRRRRPLLRPGRLPLSRCALRVLVGLTVFLVLAVGTAEATDQPAPINRIGRFLGLVASCGCSDISPERMIADYAQVLGNNYSAAEVKAMKGYVELGADEHWDNQASICAGVCIRRCMVNAAVAPLGGRLSPGIESCPISERDMDLEEPRHGSPH